MIQDIALVFQWWIPLFAIGIIFFPLTILLFNTFDDLGYSFSKIIGAVIISFTAYIISFFHIAPFSTLTLYLIAWIFFLIGCIVFRKKGLRRSIGKNKKIIITEELLFFLALVLWSIIRGFQPDINGLEKFMDFGFVNSILRSAYMPPTDMWFPPDPINYYYFGHLITAVLTKISLLPSYISYNLMIATIFALCVTESFSIGYNLTKSNRIVKRILASVISALLVTVAGNLHTLYSFFKPYQNEHPKPLWELAFSPKTFADNGYWYPNATRFIYNTIHEFPIYSFVVSDLHGHVLGIPIVLFLIAFLYQIFLAHHFSYKAVAVTGFFLAVAYMTNAWDLLIYGMLTFLVLLSLESKYLTIRGVKKSQNYFSLKHYSFSGISIFLRNSIFKLGLLGLVVVIFSYPFNSAFSPFASKIGILCSPNFLIKMGSFGPFLFEKDHCQHSPWWQLLILYGFFYFFVFSFFTFLAMRKKYIPSKADVYVTILILVSTILLVTPEFIYAKDIYPAHYRANTMFKLAYQAFMMLSLSSAYILVHLSKETKNKLFAGFSVFLLTIVFIYPFFAIPSYYNNLKTYKGLDGIMYLSKTRPADYSAIHWINNHIKGQPVILEAQGDSYTDYERISANTGLPTILGWTVHEWLWRGTYDITLPRIEDVKTIYESTDTEKTTSLLKKYNVSYVYIGNLEYEKYPNLNSKKFENMGNVVFEEGTTKLIRLTNQNN